MLAANVRTSCRQKHTDSNFNINYKTRPNHATAHAPTRPMAGNGTLAPTPPKPLVEDVTALVAVLVVPAVLGAAVAKMLAFTAAVPLSSPSIASVDTEMRGCADADAAVAMPVLLPSPPAVGDVIWSSSRKNGWFSACMGLMRVAGS